MIKTIVDGVSPFVTKGGGVTAVCPSCKEVVSTNLRRFFEKNYLLSYDPDPTKIFGVELSHEDDSTCVENVLVKGRVHIELELV